MMYWNTNESNTGITVFHIVTQILLFLNSLIGLQRGTWYNGIVPIFNLVPHQHISAAVLSGLIAMSNVGVFSILTTIFFCFLFYHEQVFIVHQMYPWEYVQMKLFGVNYVLQKQASGPLKKRRTF
jgi:hypothetical protein